ncbi:PAS domain-containing protein [Methylomonas methanica]|uniref:Sensory/regulatory protein RpfC n=1 Tax=Methylomonas methanica (strain DSM 25384 / MC09) TaxID=857087 RepID=F9ZWV0_METMM|nr:PAS domain-containing protein [Methylomonas methanica]AEG02112.1 multi-sensor hybrid histidine kinase [Methylomonas methanica MC09]
MTPDSAPRRAAHPVLPLIAAAILFVAATSVGAYQHFNDTSYLIWLQLSLSGTGFICLIRGILLGSRQAAAPNIETGICFTRLPQPAMVVDRHGIIRGINQAAAQLVDRSPDRLVNQPVHELFHPPLSKQDCPLCRHIAAGQELAATDFAFPEQHWQQISLSTLPLNDPDQLLQLHFDITARKKIERRLALVIDGAELGYWDWNYVTGKHEVNQRWLDMLGLAEDELDNYIKDWEHRIHPEDRDRVRNTILAHIASGSAYVVEFRMLHKSGRWVWIQGSGSVVEQDPVTCQATRLCGTHQNITARKQFEQNLQAAYQVISQSPSVVLKWSCREGLPIEFATDNVGRLLDYSEQHLVTGKVRYLNLIHPDDITTFRAELENSSNNPECSDIVHQPYRIITGIGSIKWVQDHKVIGRDDQGQVIGYQGLVTDITRQRQQNSAIRNIISGSLESTPDAILDNFSLLAAETLAADYTVIGEATLDGICKTLSFCALNKSDHPSPYVMHPSVYAHLSAGAICSHKQLVYHYFSDDKWLINHGIQGFIGIPMQNDRQRVCGYVVALYRHPIPDLQFAEDILKLFAAQITSELERSQAIHALEVQKQRLVDAQSISHIGDWQWHWSDNHFSWSEEMYRITGTHRSSFIPSFASFLTQLVHPDDRNIYKTALQSTHNNDSVDFKHRIVLNNGEIRHVHQRGKVIRDDRHRANGIQGTMQDITERLKTEQRLLEAKQEAEKATQVKSEFLANMSHEIRTPMNAIVGLVELCLNSDISSKQRDYLERVETAAHGLTNLIDDILDFSKMESGKLRLDAVPFVLEEMLDQVFSTMAELCRRKQLKLIRPSIDQDYHAVMGDPQRLRQVLINLIGNAIKFTERGQIEVSFTELQRTDKHTTLEFCITDTGIGMTEQQQTRLFKAFSQGDSSVTRTYGGTGLGLAISKQLIEQMGGAISVKSQEQKGSCFSFTVTLGLTDIKRLRLSSPRPDIDTRRLHHIRGARILLVEDNEVNRIVAIELLTQAHLQVDTAENGEIALLKLKQTQYDCVLMDVQMPVMDGYETTRCLRKQPDCTNLPVIAMTANVMNVDRDKCLEAGMDDFIGKPIMPGILYAALTKWIKPRDNGDMPTERSPDHVEEIPFLYGINSQLGLQHTAGDKAVYRKVLQKFATNHANSMNEISEALTTENLSAARQLVHTLKGLAGSLGANSLQGHLQRLEESLAEQGTNIQNAPTINKLINLAAQELSRVINSIQSTIPALEPDFKHKQKFSSSEIQHQLRILLDKLQAFDSDADQQLDFILSGIYDPLLIDTLTSVRKQIAQYQFVEAALAVRPLIDSPER